MEVIEPFNYSLAGIGGVVSFTSPPSDFRELQKIPITHLSKLPLILPDRMGA